MDYCKTCVYYPPSSCDGKPCTQCEPESLFHNCYVNKEDYITKERMDERLAMMHKLYPDAKQTNADRIRAMTDEELSYYLDGLAGDGCPPQMSPICNKERYKCNVRKCWLEWLKQEATDGS